MKDWCFDVRIFRKISGPNTRGGKKSLVEPRPKAGGNSDNDFFRLCVYYLFELTQCMNMKEDTFFMAAYLTKIGWRRLKEPAIVSILIAGKYGTNYFCLKN